MTKTLKEMLSEVEPEGPSSIEICPNWFNGRAAYGGLVGALAATAMEKSVEGDKPLRSFMANFVGPVPPETVEVTAKVLRSGKSVTQAVVDVTHEGQVLTHASAAFGVSRPTVAADIDPDFDAKPKESVPALDDVARALPGFLNNFTIHWTGGSIPMSGSKDTRLGMWVRHKGDVSGFPAAKIIAIADVPPPLMLSHYTRMVRASSLSWAMEFVRPPEEVDTTWFYLDFTLEAASGGYCQQSGRIFDEKGQLCAITRQCMVYFE